MGKTINNTLPAFIAALSMLILSGCFSDHPPLRCHEYGSGYFLNDSTIILLEVETRQEYRDINPMLSEYIPTGILNTQFIFYSLSQKKISSRFNPVNMVGKAFSGNLSRSFLSNENYFNIGREMHAIFDSKRKKLHFIDSIRNNSLMIFIDPEINKIFSLHYVLDINSGKIIDSLSIKYESTLYIYDRLHFLYHNQKKIIAFYEKAFFLVEYEENIANPSTKITELENQSFKIEGALYFDDLNDEFIVHSGYNNIPPLSFKVEDLLEGKVLPDTVDYVSGTITSQNSDKTSAVSATRGLTIFHKDKKPEIIFPKEETCHELE